MNVEKRIAEIGERLSQRAKADLVEVLEGLSPVGGAESTFASRLEPTINDICSQLSDAFKQAVRSRLLPEAVKLSRAPGISAPTWPGSLAPSLGSGTGNVNLFMQQHHENDILGLGFAPGTAQPLRPDQGPPQGAASAAASTLLLGASAAASSASLAGSTPSGPLSGGGAALHPQESRFSFATFGVAPGSAASAEARRGTDGALGLGLGQPSPAPRGASYGGQASSGSGAMHTAESAPVDPLLFLGLDVGGGAGGLSRGVAHLSLGGAAAISPARAPSPGFASSLQLSSLRPGSSLDPGLAAPPVSLPGTEPLPMPRLGSASVPGAAPGGGYPAPTQQAKLAAVMAASQQQQQQASAAGTPMPVFNGAPGPNSGGAAGLQQAQAQLQALQRQQAAQAQSLQQRAGSYGGEAPYSNGNGSAALYAQQLQQQQQFMLLQQQYGAYGAAAQSVLNASRPGSFAPAPDGPRHSLDGALAGSYGLGPADLLQQAQQSYELQGLMFGSGTTGTGPGTGAGSSIGSASELQLQPQSGFGGDVGLGGGLLGPGNEYGMYGSGRAEAAPLPPMAGGGAARLSRGGPSPQGGPPPPPPPSSSVCGPRSSRSGAASASAASVGSAAADSRSSSFSAGQPNLMHLAGRPAGAPGAAAPGAAAGPAPGQVQSPAASDASGPTSGPLSMAAKLQQVASKPAPGQLLGPGVARLGTKPAGPLAGPATPGSTAAAAAAIAAKVPGDMPGRFRCLPPSVQARIHALTRDNHVVLLKDFDEKVLSKMTLLVDKFGASECLAMLDRIEEVLKGKAGRLANGPGYLDVSVSTRLDELKQRATGQVTPPEDYARSTLHSRIYAELRDLIGRHGFLQWHHFDQGIVNMLKKMPNATALERLNELAYHSFKNVDNPKSCIVSIFTTKPKYSSGAA
ncbi:hypothetical protein HYH03_012366 [Edaphochlamys debaryana]|uniref:Uncharacterized protein n=1 Tax=Edaphochlamys debaryana TaxID=47281 RepID=A0A835XYC7_9CHLO|nr:hypothetical protein HYH03_012366 [Edaphochlamys debaryana]|eukprot:KAG2489140.1 hypothetical protein HYH03_012366 [Edaphochlamys debaryana]